MANIKLELVELRKEFGELVAVDDMSLGVEEGETMALLGPSGCGKSTILNMIVGLEAPTSGDILIDGKSVLAVPPGQRNVGLVFQDYAVFTPHEASGATWNTGCACAAWTGPQSTGKWRRSPRSSISPISWNTSHWSSARASCKGSRSGGRS